MIGTQISKLSHLNAAINPALRGALVYVDLPSDYDEWISKVYRTADKLEAIWKYRTQGSKDTETWHTNDPSILVQNNSYKSQQKVDYEGDITMEGASISIMTTQLRKKGPRLNNLEQSEKISSENSRKPWAP